MIGEGISVNVTLIFSIERYQAVIDAYLEGLDTARAAGRDLAPSIRWPRSSSPVSIPKSTHNSRRSAPQKLWLCAVQRHWRMLAWPITPSSGTSPPTDGPHSPTPALDGNARSGHPPA